MAGINPFAYWESTHCPLFFSPEKRQAPLGFNTLAQEWPQGLLYAPPLPPSDCFLLYCKISGSDSCCSIVAPHALVLRYSTSPGRPSPGASTQTRSSVTGSRNTAPPISSETEAVGLAPERSQLFAMGLSEPVVHTFQLPGHHQ